MGFEGGWMFRHVDWHLRPWSRLRNECKYESYKKRFRSLVLGVIG